MLASIAVLFTQKLAFATLGLAGFAVYYALDARLPGGRRDRLAQVAAAAAGALVPVVALMAWFAYQDALADMFYFDVVFNAGWPHRFRPWGGLRALVLEDPVLPIALLWWAARAFARERAPSRDAMLVACAVAALVGVFVIPEPYHQCYQSLLPLLAVMVADVVVSLARRLPVGVAPLAIAAVAMILALTAPFRHASNAADRRRLTWVMDATAPDDAVLGGWPGYGAFRPSAWFYWSAQRSVIERIPEADKERLTLDVASGAVRPKLISLSSAALISPQLRDEVMSLYVPGQFGYWVRR
jgi:hypothetical protein